MGQKGGGFHKASTLVQWARAQVVDVQAQRLAVDRLLSFRGDDEKSWLHAEKFLMKELLAQDLGARPPAPAAPASR